MSHVPGPASEEPSPTAPPSSAPDGKATALSVRATLGWAFLAFLAAQVVGTLVIMAWNLANGREALTPPGFDGAAIALITLFPNPVQVAVLVAAVRRTNIRVRDYFGLTGFSWRDFVIGFLALAALEAAIDIVSHYAGLDTVPPFQTQSYSSALAEGWAVPLALAVIVVGPVGEELMFRGFLFRGWVTSDQYGVFAVIVISELWAGMHVQYDLFGIGQVFVTGLVLGWIRWRSGSTLLTIMLHALVNLESTIETAAKVGWPSS